MLAVERAGMKEGKLPIYKEWGRSALKRSKADRD
jgi:hypothetical protein